MVINMDRKEYLDPRAYGIGEETVADFIESNGGVMAGLVISLIHSTGSGGGDIEASSAGTWAGDRIAICALEDMEDFERYKDVSMSKKLLIIPEGRMGARKDSSGCVIS